MEMFPMFLKLAGHPCLVVGAGVIAEGKIDSLVRCGASVRVIAPVATQAVQDAAAAGTIVWKQRRYLPSDLTGMFLVVAATSSPELHEQIFQQAQRASVLCNVVDEPDRCDFYYPATVRRGPFQIAISTSGRAPSLAQRIRQDLERQFGPEYGAWTEELGRLRNQLVSDGVPLEKRREALHDLCSDPAFQDFRRTNALLAGKAAANSPGQQTPETQESRRESGKVYFLGAGPGDPDLLTRKAWKILVGAEVVLHDALVPDEIVQLAPSGAIVCDVGKRCGHASITQEAIHSLLIGYAAAGFSVVRLQGGDPLIFGRGGEEMAALRDAGVPFEIVPGVTAASAAAAAAQISLTDRRLAASIIFLSAHRRKGELEGDGILLPAQSGLAETTLAIYMPGSSYARVARQLFAAGLDAETPCLVISQASTAGQSLCRTNLGQLAHTPALPSPALLIVGKVAAQPANDAAGEPIASAGKTVEEREQSAGEPVLDRSAPVVTKR